MLMVRTSFKKNGALGKPSPLTTSLTIKQVSIVFEFVFNGHLAKPLNNYCNSCVASVGYLKLAEAFCCFYVMAYGW